MWHNVRLLNTLSNIFMAVFALAVLVYAGSWLLQKPIYALQSVKVQPAGDRPLQHVNALTVRGVALPNIRGNFFTVDLDEVRKAFRAVPWVKEASVRREWPGRLVVSLEEYKPLGTWGDDGQLLSTEGQIFTVNMAEAEEDYNLLAFSGPEGTEKEVLARYAEFKEAFGPLNLEPAEVRLSDRYSWSVRLNNGMQVEFGREENENTLKGLMARLKAVYPQLVKKMGSISRIDMRYPNGLAVKAGTKQPESGEE